jgi:hypothetical protein
MNLLLLLLALIWSPTDGKVVVNAGQAGGPLLNIVQPCGMNGGGIL